MTSKRLYFMMLTGICLLALIMIGGAYFASNFLQGQAKTLVDARSKSMALQQQQTQLARAKASIAKYEDVGTIAKSIVPQDKDQAQAVREIVKIANANGVRLGNITFPSSTLGGPAGAVAPAAGGTTKPATPSGNGNLSQLKAVPGMTGVYSLQITVTSDQANPTPYAKFIDFLAALERNRRTALVSGITLQPDTKDTTRVAFTLTIDEYIKP